MAICRIIETGATPEQYDQVSERLGIADSPPPGAQLHVAALTDDGRIRVLEVWDSRDQAEQFTERVRAARDELGATGPPSIIYMDVHRLLRAWRPHPAVRARRAFRGPPLGAAAPISGPRA